MEIDKKTKESKLKFEKFQPKDIYLIKKKISFFSWNSIGNKISIGTNDGTLKIMNLVSKGQVHFFEKYIENRIFSEQLSQIVWINTDTLLLLSNNDKSLKIINLSTYFSNQNMGITNNKLNYYPKKVIFKGKLKKLFVLSKDEENLSIFNVNMDENKIEDEKHINLMTIYKYKVSDFEIDDKKKIIILISSFSPNIGLLSISENTFLKFNLIQINSFFAFNYSIIINDHLNIFAITGNDGLITLWDMNEYISYRTLKKGESCIKSISFSPCNNYISALYDEPLLDIFDLHTGEVVFSISKRISISSLSWNSYSNSISQPIIGFISEEKQKEEGIITFVGINI